MTATDLKPGIYDGLPRAEYEAWPAANFSWLKSFARTPAHARAARIVPQAPTVPLEVGAATHVSILEPHRFKDEYIEAPECDRRTKAGKATWNAWKESANGRTVLAADDYATVTALHNAFWEADSTARALMQAPGKAERSFNWLAKATGLACKARCDRMCKLDGWTWVIDLKTSRRADRDEFAKDCARYFYHVQAAFYLDGLAALADVPRRWVWVVLEKEPPYLSACYVPTERMLVQGRRTYCGWLKTLAECEATGQWPGYPGGFCEVDLPRWAQDEQADDW